MIVGNDVSFTLEAGEVLCLLGPNGAGKTTLFKTILGLVPPLGGDRHGGRRGHSSMVASKPRTGVRLRAAGAEWDFFPFTIREVVLMGRTARIGLFGTPSARDREITDELLRLLGIDGLADRSYTDVSGGERQLALIARALAQEPQVLVMDEPTASLDFGNQVRVLSEIKTLAQARHRGHLVDARSRPGLCLRPARGDPAPGSARLCRPARRCHHGGGPPRRVRR